VRNIHPPPPRGIGGWKIDPTEYPHYQQSVSRAHLESDGGLGRGAETPGRGSLLRHSPVPITNDLYVLAVAAVGRGVKPEVAGKGGTLVRFAFKNS
jgi:hypothetical protein